MVWLRFIGGVLVGMAVLSIGFLPASAQDTIWHVKAVHPQGRFLDVKALDQDGNIHDVKAFETAADAVSIPVPLAELNRMWFWGAERLRAAVIAWPSKSGRSRA